MQAPHGQTSWMTDIYAFDAYVEWLQEKVNDGKHDNYNRLMTMLASIDFFYLLSMDENRAKDGIGLRELYSAEHGVGFVFNYRPCSILEMMIALAMRCDLEIMYDFEVGSQASKWFWSMIDNLGLSAYDDEHFDEDAVALTLHKLLYREYGSHGEGGLFYVRNPRRDLRDVDIWYQMQWYLVENKN